MRAALSAAIALSRVPIQIRLGIGCLAVLSAVGYVVSLFGPTSDYDYGELPPPQPPSRYLSEVIDRLQESPLYVDPLLAELIEIPVSADEVPAEVYVAFLPQSSADGSFGQGTEIARTIHAEFGTDGFYAVVGEDGVCDAIRVSGDRVLRALCPGGSATDLETMVERGTTTNDDDWIVAWVFPPLVGVGICILLWPLLWLAGWVRRRDVAYFHGTGTAGG